MSTRWAVLLCAAVAGVASVAGCGDNPQTTYVADDRSDPVPAAGALVSDVSVCGGTLIAPDVVLTSNRCAQMTTRLHTEFVVNRGAYSSDRRESYLVRYIHSHPESIDNPCDLQTDERQAACQFVAERCGNLVTEAAITCLTNLPRDVLTAAGYQGLYNDVDLALLILDHPVPNIEPALLLHGPHALDKNTGATLERVGHDFSPPSERTNSRGGTLRKFQAYGEVAQNNAAQLNVSSYDACNIDLGGPVFTILDDRNGARRRFLAGVAQRPFSIARGGANCNEGLVYSRTDVAFEWIDSTMRDACASGERVDCAGGGGLPGTQPGQGCSVAGASFLAVPVVLLLLVRNRRRQRLGLGLVLLGASGLLGACGDHADTALEVARGSQAYHPIVDGTPAIDRYPETGAVTMRGSLCSGTLIAPDVVLTAAHCIDRGSRVEFTHSWVGYHNDRASRTLVRAAEIHPGYNLGCTADLPASSPLYSACKRVHRLCDYKADSAELDVCLHGLPRELLDAAAIFTLATYHDIALLFLAEPVLGIDPVPPLRPEEAQRAGTFSRFAPPVLRNVGFGYRQRLRGDNGDLFGAGLRYFADNSIVAASANEFRLGTEPPQGCWGDSGGPAFTTLSDGQRRVAGVASRLADSFTCETGLTFTRVDAYIPWIDATMRAAAADGRRFSGTWSPKTVERSTPEAALPDSCGATRGQGFVLAALGLFAARARKGRRPRPTENF